MPLSVPSNTELDLWAMDKARLIIQIIADEKQGGSVKKGDFWHFNNFSSVLNHVKWGETESTAVQKMLGKLGYNVSVEMKHENESYLLVTFNDTYSFEITTKTLKYAEACAKDIWDWIGQKFAGLTLEDGFEIPLHAGTGVVNIPKMLETPGILVALNRKFKEKYGFTFTNIYFKGRKGVGGHDLVLVV